MRFLIETFDEGEWKPAAWFVNSNWALRVAELMNASGWETRIFEEGVLIWPKDDDLTEVDANIVERMEEFVKSF